MTELLSRAAIDQRVVDCLQTGDTLLPIETELWDYKRQADSHALGLANTVLDVVAMHNTFGGYLIYGVDETDTGGVVPVGLAGGAPDCMQIKQSIQNYTGESIDIAVGSAVSGPHTLAVLYVPKRPSTSPPISFGKNGPDAGPRNPLFVPGLVYFRQADRCVRAVTSSDFAFVVGPRHNPHLWDASTPATLRPPLPTIISHTLPDRNVICPHFVGRTDIIRDLWQWLGDEFVHVKLLVGDGGKGKTSIAYQFSVDVCSSGAYEMDKLIWLTAKSRRFVGRTNDYVEMPETHFSDTYSLLEALANQLPLLPDEIKDSSPHLLKKLLKQTLAETRCMVVVDDVDSADLEEQKEIINTAMQLAGHQARFLITTRMNFALGADHAIPVGGLPDDDFREFLDSVCSDLGLAVLNDREFKQVLAVTEGSPLFAESLLRLKRTGMPLDLAIKEWKGKLGQEARDAALKKEINALTLESRRVLYACAVLGEASLSELKLATKYIEERAHQCIAELQALFLVSAPKIIKGEPRFAVSASTQLLIVENSKLLVADQHTIDKNIKALRSEGSKKPAETLVGAAINQAVALLRENRYQDAITTIDSALNKRTTKSSDLLSVRAMALLGQFKAEGDRKSLEQARRDLKASHDAGHRKPAMYERWYEAEILAEHWIGAVEVASLSLADGVEPAGAWRRMKASAGLELARSHVATSNISMAIQEYDQAADDINESRRAGDMEGAVQRLLEQTHDEAWAVHLAMPGDIPDIRARFESLQRSIGRGDKRAVLGRRCIDTLGAMIEAMPSKLSASAGLRNLLQQAVRETDSLLRRIEVHRTEAHGWSLTLDRWNALRRMAADF